MLTCVVAFGTSGGSPATAASSTYTHGFDLSWPQCHGHSARHMPSGQPAYAILGLTHGTGHTVNPCLGSQLQWARAHQVRVGAYLVASYPTHRQRLRANHGFFGRCHGRVLCMLRNDGARQTVDALRILHRHHMRSPMVWLDVEFRHTHAWTHSNRLNRAVIQGMVRTLRHLHKRFGVYTTGYMWRSLLGRYRLVVPQWLPSGRGQAWRTKPMCWRTATGGPTWLVQYTRGLDQDLTCPLLDPTRDRSHSGHGFLLSRIVARA